MTVTAPPIDTRPIEGTHALLRRVAAILLGFATAAVLAVALALAVMAAAEASGAEIELPAPRPIPQPISAAPGLDL
jgi:hypothetical protein